MKFRGLLIALICLVVLAGGLYLAGKRKSKSEAEATKTSEKLFAVPADDIQQITLAPASGEKVTLERSGDKWTIAEPAGVRADDYATSSVASALGGLTVSDVIADKPAVLKEYGLDPPQATVKFRTKSGAEHTLLIGEDTPTGGGLYAKTGSQPRVVTLSSYVKSDLTKSLLDLRDKTVLKIDTGTASRAWLTNKSGKLELVKSADRWQLAAPVQGRADQSAVEDLLRSVADAKLQSAEGQEAKATEAKFGLGSPEIMLKVQDASGTHELSISADRSGQRYARSSEQSMVFTVASDLVTALSKPAADLRNKDIFDFESWTANSIAATTPEAHLLLTKEKDEWKGADPKKAPDAGAVSDLLDKLKAIRAEAFPPPGPAAKYGLDRPVLRVQLTWGEKKQQETLELGMAGKKAYARRAGEPAIYEVSADKLKEARDAANKLK
jgi:hypothetical protein